MKRTSTFIALLILLCGVGAAQARHSQRYRVQYNPYAFSYSNSGLVPGGVAYSMYAFRYGHSGLIQEYQTCPTLPCRPCVGCTVSTGSISINSQCASAPACSVSARRFSATKAKPRWIREKDGLDVIREYLAQQGHRGIYVKHHLSIENETIGAAIVLTQSNLVITYTNAEALASLAEETGYKKHAVDRMEQSLAETLERTLAKGGQVYNIDTSDKDQIVVALQDYAPLNPNTPTSTAVYAKN